MTRRTSNRAIKSELKRGADFIRKYPASRILIAGHTDSTASDAYNKGLSQRRAESIRSYLISNFGIKAERLDAKGYGESFPIADNATTKGRGNVTGGWS